MTLASLALDVLPFEAAAPNGAPVPSAAQELPPLPLLPAADLNATSLGTAPVSIDETMPFLGGYSVRKEIAARRAAIASAAGASAPTSAFPAASAPAAPVAAHTPGAPTAPTIPTLTVEQFASLCASCDVEPENAREIEQRYGIADADARRALDAAWKERLREPAVYEAFRARFQAYRGWLFRKLEAKG